MIVLSTKAFGTSSSYLLNAQKIIIDIIDLFKNSFGSNGTILVIGILFLILMYKYTCPMAKKGEPDSKEYKSKSLYYEINSIISMLYIVVTVLAFLPFFM